MSAIVSLPGAAALSPFRVDKIRSEAAQLGLKLVTPRPGTISPWSSKATDILKNCGLSGFRRIERGVAFHVTDAADEPLSAEARARLLPLLHDRMTEAVMTLADVEQLFRHVPPRELTGVDVIGGGRDALEAANRALGLALSDDELDYLVANFSRIERNPTDVELMM